jgi:hypothetical protein
MSIKENLHNNTLNYLKENCIELEDNQTPLEWLKDLLDTESIKYQSENENYVANILSQILDVSEVSVPSDFDKWADIKVRNEELSFYFKLEEDINLVKELENIAPKPKLRYLVVISNSDNTLIEYKQVASLKEALEHSNLNPLDGNYEEFVKNFSLGGNPYADGTINVTVIYLQD